MFAFWPYTACLSSVSCVNLAVNQTALTSYKEDTPDLRGQRGRHPQSSNIPAPRLALNVEVINNKYNAEVANSIWQRMIVQSCIITRFGSLVIVVLPLKFHLCLLFWNPSFPFGKEALVKPPDLCPPLTFALILLWWPLWCRESRGKIRLWRQWSGTKGLRIESKDAEKKKIN